MLGLLREERIYTLKKPKNLQNTNHQELEGYIGVWIQRVVDQGKQDISGKMIVYWYENTILSYRIYTMGRTSGDDAMDHRSFKQKVLANIG